MFCCDVFFFFLSFVGHQPTKLTDNLLRHFSVAQNWLCRNYLYLSEAETPCTPLHPSCRYEKLPNNGCCHKCDTHTNSCVTNPINDTDCPARVIMTPQEDLGATKPPPEKRPPVKRSFLPLSSSAQHWCTLAALLYVKKWILMQSSHGFCTLFLPRTPSSLRAPLRWLAGRLWNKSITFERARSSDLTVRWGVVGREEPSRGGGGLGW